MYAALRAPCDHVRVILRNEDRGQLSAGNMQSRKSDYWLKAPAGGHRIDQRHVSALEGPFTEQSRHRAWLRNMLDGGRALPVEGGANAGDAYRFPDSLKQTRPERQSASY